jgi:hypothetical protein
VLFFKNASIRSVRLQRDAGSAIERRYTSSMRYIRAHILQATQLRALILSWEDKIQPPNAASLNALDLIADDHRHFGACSRVMSIRADSR